MDCNQRDNSFQSKQLRRPGVTILKEILRTIKIDEILINENNLILQVFLSTFIDEMKQRDELFKEVFHKIHYTGSFYSDLQISEPNEFDINIILKMPLEFTHFEIKYCSPVPSFALYHLKNQRNFAVLHEKLLRNFFQDGYLLHKNVKRLLQEAVDKALFTYTLPSGVLRVNRSASVSTLTLQLQKSKGIIDVNLVPVLSCCLQTKQPGIADEVCEKLGVTLESFLVPKPYPGIKAPWYATELSYLWRKDFTIAENALLHNYGCVKPIIKLLKLLRDKEGWKVLASYYLKTVVMWMLLWNPNKDYWKEDKIDERFIEALQNLQLFMEDENLPYLYSNRHNLISMINSHETINIANRLSVIIRDARNDPENFWRIFCVEPTF